MRVFNLLCVAAVALASNLTVTVDWSTPVGVETYRTTTTIQVVSNAILSRSSLCTNVTDNAWKALADLDADLIRYVPWFPMPVYGVANLNGTSDGWDFTFLAEMLDDFMNATYARNHTTVINFSTQPAWLYADPPPAATRDPLATDFGYPPRTGLLDPTGKDLALYYGRLASWMTKGQFVDDKGVVHTGGRHYNLTHWEVFNEPVGCHGMTGSEYTAQYDAVVEAIRNNVPEYLNVKFMGLAIAGIHVQPNLDWFSTFLNHSNHKPGVPLDYISFHHYGKPTSRTDPSTYPGMFDSVQDLSSLFQTISAMRDELSPSTKISIDEVGVILPDDNSPSAPQPPASYWPAAGAFFAAVFSQLSVLGVDILGQSQLAGNPVLPECGITDSQFPGVSLLDYNTGVGNAKYWVSKLLQESFSAGNTVVKTTISSGSSAFFCGEVDGHNGYGNLSLTCSDPTAVISAIDFAAFGTPTGTCGSYAVDSHCNAANTTAVVTAACKGKNSCTVPSLPTFGDPCFGVFKRLVVQAECSAGNGHASPPAADTHDFAQAFTRGSTHSLLYVNGDDAPKSVTLAPWPAGASATVLTVDEASGNGAPRRATLKSAAFTATPFSTNVIVWA